MWVWFDATNGYYWPYCLLHSVYFSQGYGPLISKAFPRKGSPEGPGGSGPWRLRFFLISRIVRTTVRTIAVRSGRSGREPMLKRNRGGDDNALAELRYMGLQSEQGPISTRGGSELGGTWFLLLEGRYARFYWWEWAAWIWFCNPGSCAGF